MKNEKNETETEKDTWEEHRVSRPIPLDEELAKKAQEKSKQTSLFDMLGTPEPEETKDEL